MNKRKLKIFKIGLLILLFLLFWFFDFVSPIHEIITFSFIGLMWLADKYVAKLSEDSTKKK
jgi:hypothetical protein